jgi:peptidoglycan/xylan/chitin deacetylase (PgdA/CDA1 family)
VGIIFAGEMTVIRNFLFHRVSPERDKLWDPMSIALFEKSIKYISENYKIIQVEELTDLNSAKAKDKLASISFDDGYKDNITYALPILDKYKVKASFHVVTDCIDKNIPTWTHIIEYLFQFSKKNKIELGFDFFPEHLKISEFKNQTEKATYPKKLIPFLKTITHQQRNAVIETIQNSFNDIELPQLMMNWNELKELSVQGHFIGSHSVTHSLLGKMTDETEIKSELLNSGNSILKNIGYFPKVISYPIGSYNSITIRLSKECGYKIGLATKQDVYKPERDSIFEVPRIELYNEPWWKTRMRITNMLENIKTTIHYK